MQDRQPLRSSMLQLLVVACKALLGFGCLAAAGDLLVSAIITGYDFSIQRAFPLGCAAVAGFYILLHAIGDWQRGRSEL